MNELQKQLVSLPRWKKRAALSLADVLLVVFAFWLSFSLRLGTWFVSEA